MRQVDAVPGPLPVDERRRGRGRSGDECQQRVVESDGTTRTEVRLDPPHQRTLVITTLARFHRRERRDELAHLLGREGEPGRCANQDRERALELRHRANRSSLVADRGELRRAPCGGGHDRCVIDRDPLQGEGQRGIPAARTAATVSRALAVDSDPLWRDAKSTAW